MQLALRKRANSIGFSSILLSLVPWIWVRAVTGIESPYNIIGLAGALGLSLILAILAAILGSRWWFLALLGPLCGAMLLFSLRA
jgi:hypothetical protein